LGRHEYESLLKRTSELEAKVQPIHEEYTEFEARRKQTPPVSNPGLQVESAALATGIDPQPTLAEHKERLESADGAKVPELTSDDSSEEAAGDASGDA